MHTKEMIMIALQELRNEYDPVIWNYNYRGSYEIHPSFTVKEIAKKIERTPATTRKWCKVLAEEKKLIQTWQKCYFANSSMTMLFRRVDTEIVKLRQPTYEEQKLLFGW